MVPVHNKDCHIVKASIELHYQLLKSLFSLFKLDLIYHDCNLSFTSKPFLPLNKTKAVPYIP